MRIHELAKEIGVDNKVIVEFLKNAGANVKSHMSACPEDMIDKVRAKFGKGDAAKAPAAETPKSSRKLSLPVPLTEKRMKTAESRSRKLKRKRLL